MTEFSFHQASSSVKDAPRQNAYLTFRGNVKYGRHGWLRLTPAYSLHVVNDILAEASPDDFILDPFSGTGTTALAGTVLGVRAHAVDLNPFLVWLGNLKIRSYSPELLDKLLAFANEIPERLTNTNQQDNVWVPPIHQIEKWWNGPNLSALAKLYHFISQQDSGDCTLADLLRIVFCRVAIETSNASFGHQSMSFKKTSKHEQPLLLDEDLINNATARIASLFVECAREIVDGIRMETPLAEGHVYLGDSRELQSVLPLRTYTKVITSPPYPNRMSYIRELRPYMYWLGYLNNGRQAGEIDWQAIGGTWGSATSNLGAWRPDPSCSIPYAGFDGLVREIEVENVLLGRYVRKYFEDMFRHFRNLENVMSSGGSCYYIIGNSKFYSTLVPAEKIYASLLAEVGFRKIRIDVLRKRNSKKELYEFIVKAEKP